MEILSFVSLSEGGPFVSGASLLKREEFSFLLSQFRKTEIAGFTNQHGNFWALLELSQAFSKCCKDGLPRKSTRKMKTSVTAPLLALVHFRSVYANRLYPPIQG